jgi:hypothetical protein
MLNVIANNNEDQKLPELAKAEEDGKGRNAQRKSYDLDMILTGKVELLKENIEGTAERRRIRADQ